MTSTGSEGPAPVYPAPTVVVGVGRLGLAVLERLGEDWRTLSQAGSDPSLANLRLVHVRSREADEEPDDESGRASRRTGESADGTRPLGRNGEPDWGRREEQTARIARYVGESDLPSLAVNLMILRSLGLVRFRDGSYQVAVPQDGGVVEKGDDPDSSTNGDGLKTRLERRRYFDWRDIGPDPILAVERLHRLAERASDLDLFITPILSRVRQGHSPRALLDCIARCASLAEGRDPSPWPWLWDRLEALDAAAKEAAEEGTDEWTIQVGDGDRERASKLFGLVPEDLPRKVENSDEGHIEVSHLDGFAEPPLRQWDLWTRNLEESLHGATASAEPPELVFRLPGIFLPRENDPRAPLKPKELLRVDWETTGWATEGFRPEDYVLFEPAAASPFRLGLFDHDDTLGRRRRHPELKRRLQELAKLVHRGLVRLWVDLQRERVEERDLVLDDRRREGDEEALRQSLEILGEMLVRPLSSDEAKSDEAKTDGVENEALHEVSGDGERTGRDPAEQGPCRPPTAEVEGRGLPKRPSKFLTGLRFPHRSADPGAGALERRLAALGLADPAARGLPRTLLRQVTLGPEDLEPPSEPSAPLGRSKPPGLKALDRVLNEEVRDLFDFDYLTAYRNRPTRRPPRLTVYLVGDLGELFARTSMRVLLRETHLELLRAFTPILEFFREGFDRGLSVVPILWMPHPADPFEGRIPEYGRCEEAAIIDAVHGIRRWVESVIPPQRRRVSQIFINSRVTDKAVLPPREAARQTRDFITLQTRSDIARDDWLRATAEGPPGDDYFASFSCYEIDFPAEKSREFLANRLARDSLERLRHGGRSLAPPVSKDVFRPPELEQESQEARERLRQVVQPVARQVSSQVEEKVDLTLDSTRRELRRAFDRAFARRLADDIQRHWRELTENRGVMDGLVDKLRRSTSSLLSERVLEVRKESDRLIEELAGQGGLQRALAGFQELRDAAQEQLQTAEAQRRHREGVAERHTTPKTQPIESARQDVASAIEEKPDRKPIRAGLLAWLQMAPVLGAPLAYSVAQGFELPAALEYALGPWGAVTGGAVLFLAVWGALRLYQSRKLRKVGNAVSRMARTVRRIVEGEGRPPENEATPSIRSFFESRLMLTESLTGRGFALRIFDRMEADGRLADRLGRSVDVQLRRLTQRAEELGVRPVLAEGPDTQRRDDLRSLFTTRSGEKVERLVDPERLGEFYERWVGGGAEVAKMVPRFIDEAGGFGDWRETACLSDSERVLAVGRREFADISATPLPEQHRFADEVGERLCRFASRIYPNLGFGAKFSGYEGLDPDGVHVRADAALVLHSTLESVYRAAIRHAAQDEESPLRSRCSTPVFDVVAADGLRPNAAYMLCLAQGIRAHSVYNLKRFESYHGRPHMSYRRAFPVSGETDSESLNPLFGYREVARELSQRVWHSDGAPANPQDPEEETGGSEAEHEREQGPKEDAE